MVYPSQFRKPHRIRQFDYSSPCSYLLTFNTQGRRQLLSTVKYRGMFEPAGVELTEIGKITEAYIRRIPKAYPYIILENYVIMPDHVHLLLTLLPKDETDNSTRPGVDTVIRTTKTLITKRIGRPIWQMDFHDVIADSEKLFLLCDRYIDENPAAWLEKHDDPFSIK